MINICGACKKVLNDGDSILVSISCTYHTIPSTSTWAISREDIIAFSDTLQHVECPTED